MSVIIETFDHGAIERAEKMLAGIDGGVNKALQAAIQKTARVLRTNSAKAIRERYAISAANIRAEENVTIRYNYHDGAQVFITFSGHKIPLYRYDGASPATPTPNTSKWITAMINGEEKRVHPGMTASGHQLKGTSPKRFDNAFVARMRSGHIGIFERTGGMTSSGSSEIQEIMGSSVPQMLGNKEVLEKLSHQAMENFTGHLDYEVLRIMNGWGM